MAQIFDRNSNALARMSLVLTGLIVIALGVTLDQLQRSDLFSYLQIPAVRVVLNQHERPLSDERPRYPRRVKSGRRPISRSLSARRRPLLRRPHSRDCSTSHQARRLLYIIGQEEQQDFLIGRFPSSQTSKTQNDANVRTGALGTCKIGAR